MRVQSPVKISMKTGEAANNLALGPLYCFTGRSIAMTDHTLCIVDQDSEESHEPVVPSSPS